MRSSVFGLVVVLLAGGGAEQGAFTGKVVAVSDGDTITVLNGRTPVKVRLNGVDCPETGQDFGSRAKQATSDLAFGKVVKVEPRDTDRYGRTVADVILPDGKNLNHELVRNGWAWWFRKYAQNDGTLERLENEARAAKRGLWAQANPTPPWDWRHRELPGDLAGKIIANRKSRIFHAPGCSAAAKISEANRIAFDSEDAAERAGYRAGKDCHR